MLNDHFAEHEIRRGRHGGRQPRRRQHEAGPGPRQAAGRAAGDRRQAAFSSAEKTRQENIIGASVEGKVALMFDDMISTAGSICGARKQGTRGRRPRRSTSAATHGVLCGKAIENLQGRADREHRGHRHDSAAAGEEARRRSSAQRGAAVGRGDQADSPQRVGEQAVRVTPAPAAVKAGAPMTCAGWLESVRRLTPRFTAAGSSCSFGNDGIALGRQSPHSVLRSHRRPIRRQSCFLVGQRESAAAERSNRGSSRGSCATSPRGQSRANPMARLPGSRAQRRRGDVVRFQMVR